MKEVIIVVEGGMVKAVYSEGEALAVEIIDLDTDDPDERNELEKRLADIEDNDAYTDNL